MLLFLSRFAISYLLFVPIFLCYFPTVVLSLPLFRRLLSSPLPPLLQTCLHYVLHSFHTFSVPLFFNIKPYPYPYPYESSSICFVWCFEHASVRGDVQSIFRNAAVPCQHWRQKAVYLHHRAVARLRGAPSVHTFQPGRRQRQLPEHLPRGRPRRFCSS